MRWPVRISVGALGLIIALFAGTCICLYIETNSLEVATYALRHQGLHRALPGAKIALLADIHIRRYGSREERILAVLESEKPDLILLAGDYIHYRRSFDPARKFFSRLRAPLGVFAVLGNADYSNENGTCILCHERNSERLNSDTAPKFLRNDCVILGRGEKRINLIGLDDPVTKRRRGRINRDFEETLKKIDSGLPSILLVHSPEAMPEAAGRVDLVLAGHNHGGQVRFLSALRRLFSPEPSFDYLEGFFRERGTILYVSRGIGRSSLPFRFGAKPQMTFFRIEGGLQAAAAWSEIESVTHCAEWDGPLLIETFNPLPYLGKIKIGTKRLRNSKVLFDFEDKGDLDLINRECRTSLKRVKNHASSGAYSLKVRTGAGARGLELHDFRSDWTGHEFLKLDIFHPLTVGTPLCIRIDDSRSLNNRHDHLDRPLPVKQGLNRIGIPLNELRTNRGKRLLDLHDIERITLYGAMESAPLEFYLDHVRLE
jgi:predicted MPP superfamily phosphohydrolase